MIELLHRSNVLIDTSVLAPWCVASRDDGTADLRLGFPFDGDDLITLDEARGRAASFVTLPQICAEASNLVGQKRGGAGRIVRLGEMILALVDDIVTSHASVGDRAFRRFGFTDAAILCWMAAGPARVLLSQDVRLCAEVTSRGQSAVLFNQLRAA